MKVSDGVIAHIIVWSTVALLILGAGLAGWTEDWWWLVLGTPYAIICFWAYTWGRNIQ
jgi:hypothetical protein